MNKILVTGATGSIGSNVVRKLVDRGYDVRVLIRKTSNTLSIDGLNIERVYGDITDLPSIKEAVKGCKYVIHTAGIIVPGSVNKSIVYDINEKGALNVAQASIEEGVERFVYTSSIAAVGWGTKEKPASEETPYNFELDIPYWIAKRKAEEKIISLAKEGKLPAVVVNPAVMVGPWDVKPASGQLVQFASTGVTYFYFQGGSNFVDIEDAALGHILALEKGKIGERYILGGDNLYYKEYFSLVHKLLGNKFPPFIPIGKNLSTLIGYLGDFYIKFSSSPNYYISTFINSQVLKMLSLTIFTTSKKAQKELGFPYTPIEKSLEKQIKWLKDHGYLNNLSIFCFLKK